MSIRLRLTLWYTLILTALLGVLGFAVVNTFAATLQGAVDRTLDDTVSQVIAVTRASTVLGEVRINVPVESDVFRAAGLYLQVIDLTGEIVRKSASLGNYDRPLDSQSIQPERVAELPVRRDVRVANAHLRVLTAPIRFTTPEPLGFLQVGVSLQANDEALAQLTRILFLGGVVGLALAGVGGAFLARQALRPIDMITHTAITITDAGDLSQRVPAPGTPDEVGRLANIVNRMLARLEMLFRSQQQFTADVSHELRTPLTTIRGNVDLMRRTRVADDASLDAIQSETERMTRLVSDLLLLAQADAGLPVHREPVSLDTILLDVYRQISLIANGVVVRLGEEDAVTVLGDADRLKQLVLNLADNAVRYTPAGGRVTLGLKRDQGWAQLSVSDTGPGIAPEHLPHIFDRFYRVDQARSRRESGQSGALGGGAGLGLSIAQWIAQSHGGRIEVHSEVDQGTTFTVYLPELKREA
ncbi:MAG TPA: ATP-binding protein [Anaerolineae bacterium]|nr:ATP-binding protein [Anaerolineae bacterium]